MSVLHMYVKTRLLVGHVFQFLAKTIPVHFFWPELMININTALNKAMQQSTAKCIISKVYTARWPPDYATRPKGTLKLTSCMENTRRPNKSKDRLLKFTGIRPTEPLWRLPLAISRILKP